MHPRISVNSFCFPQSTDLDSLAADFRAVDAGRAVVVSTLLPDEADELHDWLSKAGCALESVTHLMFGFGAVASGEAAVERERAQLRRAIDIAHAADCGFVYGTTGGRGALGWAEASELYVETVRPCVEYASSRGVRLLIEPTLALNAHAHLVHTLRDTVELADRAGVGVCFDVFAAWTDPDLDEQVRRAGREFPLIQIADYVYGDRSLPCRAVPGDGDIPLRHIIEEALLAGFAGTFDLELLGPRIDAEGHRTAISRAADRLGKLLTELGV